MEPPVPEPKCIILGVPHTSGWDFVISYLYYKSVGGKAYVMIKKSFFVWPLAPLLRAMGGVEVDRGKGVSVVMQMIEQFKTRDHFHLAIAPEGTRGATTRWKAGFHTIARRADVPVYLGYFDWGKKEVGRGERFELSDNVEEDLEKIKTIYEGMGLQGKHKELYTTGV